VPGIDPSKLRYPSDLTDDEWAIIGPLIPPAKRSGNKRGSVSLAAGAFLRAGVGGVREAQA